MSGAILDTGETSVNITDKNPCSGEVCIPDRETDNNDVNKQHTYQVDNKCQGEKVKKDGEYEKDVDILGRLARQEASYRRPYLIKSLKDRKN